MYRKSCQYYITFCTLVLVFFGCEGTPPHVVVPMVRYTQSIEFESKVLDRTMRYSIYLPAHYNTETERYGTVYLLHGFGDDETAWFKGGKIHEVIDGLESNGSISSMIYIAPYGYNSYYVDYFHGGFNYMKMFTEELVPLIDSLYRTQADAQHRAVVGYSMGGYGAFILPYKNPSLFSISVPLSMSWRTHAQYCAESQTVWNSQFGAIFGGSGSDGEARLTDYYLLHDPFTLLNREQGAAEESIKYFFDCGDDEEQISVAVCDLHTIMQQNNINHQLRMRNGAHTWDYWRESMRQALPFIDDAMKGIVYPEEVAVDVKPDITAREENIVLEGVECAVFLPSDYEAEGTPCHTIYLSYAPYDNYREEKTQIAAVLDSLLQDKHAMLVMYQANPESLSQVSLDALTAQIDKNYNTRTKSYHRVLIGNNASGAWVVNASQSFPYLAEAIYLFDAKVPLTTSLAVKYVYLSMPDQGVNAQWMNMLYYQCRTEAVSHQYRINNGMSSFKAFLYNLDQSISQIGLKLNKY